MYRGSRLPLRPISVALRYEVCRILTAREFWLISALAVGLDLLLTFVTSVYLDQPGVFRDSDLAVGILTRGAALGLAPVAPWIYLINVIGIWSDEYRGRSLAFALSIVPSRLSLGLAKLIVGYAFYFCVVVLPLVTYSATLAWVKAVDRGAIWSLSLEYAWRGAFYASAIFVYGLLIGSLFRRRAIGYSFALLVPWVVEPTIRFVIEGLPFLDFLAPYVDYLPFEALRVVSSTPRVGSIVVMEPGISVHSAVVEWSILLAVIIAVYLWRTMRIEVKFEG